MNKLFTLTAVLLVSSLGAFAQNVRKTWDFRSGWSSTTVSNLQTDMDQNGAEGGTAHWRSYEKVGGTPGDQAFWNANTISVNDDGEAVVYVDGVANVIPELASLNVSGMGDRNFVIAHNFAQADNEGSPNGKYPYGSSFVWINGKNKVLKFTALKGDTIRMGLESHKNSEARGLNIAVDGQTISPIEGNNTPTFFEKVTWVLPDDTPGVDDYTTVTITTTNGCHIYYIIAGKGDAADANVKKVSYIYNGSTDNDLAYATLMANDQLQVTAIDASTTTLTREDLIGYDVNVIAPTLSVDNANVAVLKDALPWTPFLNFNGDLYPVWGYGSVAAGASNFGATSVASNQLFRGITLIDGSEAGLAEGQSGIAFTNGTPVTGVTLGEHFAGDNILATDAGNQEIVAIHTHNITHNGYIYLPFNAAALTDAYQEADQTTTLINNAVTMLVASKADITANPVPTFSMAYGNFQTTVTIKDARTDAVIYYTTDGSEPTTASTVYTEPFTVTAETTVKAIAQSEGYNPSAVGTQVVPIYEQAKGVSIAVSEADDASTITLSTETEDGVIWYNFSASNDTAYSSKYTEPIIVRDHATITAFVTSQKYVQSESVTKEIFVKNDKVYIDVASHFDANYTGLSNGAGLFSWGKSATDATVTTDEVEGTYYDEDNIEQVKYKTYPREAEVYPAEEGAEWVVKSNGQSVLWQNLNPGTKIGDGSNYNPATADDLDSRITKYDVQLYKFISGQYNARIETTKKFQAPFNILSFIGNAASINNKYGLAFQVSTDGENWTTVGDTLMITGVAQRLYKKVELLYDGTDEVYVRLAHTSGNSGAQVYDIYILTNGEESKALEAELEQAYANGIADVDAAPVKAETVAIYTINGQRVNTLKRGINIVKMSDGKTRKVLVK